MGTHRYNKLVFNYPLFYGHEHGFDDTRARGYPYSLINEVNY